uniref:Uncharacterized protein n=1 Tax=Oryza barthii TaxID=65489 RepID=A0A0D3ENK4_9ORYZ
MANDSLTHVAAVDATSIAVANAMREAFQLSTRYDADLSTATNIADSAATMASNATRKAYSSPSMTRCCYPCLRRWSLQLP